MSYVYCMCSTIHWETCVLNSVVWLRSTQRSIQLIACVTSPLLVKYGFESILKPFVIYKNIILDERLGSDSTKKLYATMSVVTER